MQNGNHLVMHDFANPELTAMAIEGPGFVKRLAVGAGIVVVLGAAVIAVSLAAAGDYGTAGAVQIAGLLLAGGILALLRLSE